MVAEAARRGARVAVLPELHLCGYDLPTLTANPGACEVPADAAGAVTDRRPAPLTEEAVRTGTLVLAGAAVRRADGALVNALLRIDPSGSVSLGYAKQHLWHADEARMFTAGTGRDEFVDIDGWCLGSAICYDMSFAAHAGAAALAGAHAYVCASAVYAPYGSLVDKAGTDREEVLVGELDPNEITRTRAFLHMLAERVRTREDRTRCRSVPRSTPAGRRP
ncbi:carbon-nitrogen hydrolase family protein [Streptomyces sp. NPDC091371]|uniref:carbon-nitrogen hydrolase family protein n=1 Tax=Streptomyces sp. NPDC091371 TaxID=3155303 RepID=UPI003414D9CA